MRLRVCQHANREELEAVIEASVPEGATVNTDEWRAYDHLAEMGHPHPTVHHAEGEYARDDDGDGVREVHVNTIEGYWTGARNFLRTFRGVNKVYLPQYLAVFEWASNEKRITPSLLRRFFTSRPKKAVTRLGTMKVNT